MSANAGSAATFVAITKSDATILSSIRGLYVGGTGDVAVKDAAGNSVIFSAVPAGSFMPIQPVQVLSTGTTATLIIGLKG